MIKAPFNFVPLNERVFFPNWSDKISHDIPFGDGESGVIELTIKAESPIFVRNGHTKEEADDNHENYKSFSNINGAYFIPGTSIKGAIRNVLEIMSFGKIKVDENAMFAQREWDNKELYPMKEKQASLKCGWLKRKGDGYIIEDCGKPYRIGHKNISESLTGYFSQMCGVDLNKEVKLNGKAFDPKTAVFKYELLENEPELFEERTFDLDLSSCNEYKDNRLMFDENGPYRGRLVLTGQPDQWKWPRPKTLTKNAGKYYEFVFLRKKRDIPFSELEFNHFKFIYQESPDWKIYKKKLDADGIPVFFRTYKKKGSTDECIKDLGLAFLYKLPYENSPYGSLPEVHKKDAIDLAECIFGYTSATKSLKGRVQFLPAFSENAGIENENGLILTLSSPKASYYPLYIRQEGRNGIVSSYQTYNDGMISGRKRYPVRKKVYGVKNPNDYSPDMDTIIYPLKSNAVFKGKIHFHNLRRIELGALLSALTFHNTDGCFHQIGQGKPYGFGKVSIDVKLPDNIDKEYFMSLFENEIKSKIGIWHESEQLSQLFTMSKEEVNAEATLFEYMHMDTNREQNEFIKAKELNKYLQLYTTLISKKHAPISLLDVYNLKMDEERKLSEEREEEIEKERKRKLKEKEDEDAKTKQKEIEQNKDDRIKLGLAFLDEKNIHGDYKVNDFKGASNRIDRWLKDSKKQEISTDDYELFCMTMIRLYSLANKKDLRDWDSFDSKTWIKIKGYIGEAEAQTLFEKLFIKIG